MRSLIAAGMLCLATVALAHDGHHDDWFKSLQSEIGSPCCDGSDALRLEDPEWEFAGDRYRVRINGEWHDVPPNAVVPVPNIVGPAFVWPGKTVTGELYIRCFLPGAGA